MRFPNEFDEQVALEDALTAYGASFGNRVQPIFTFARKILITTNLTFDCFREVIAGSEDDVRNEREKILYKEIFSFWVHMATHQSLMNLAEHRRREVQDLLSCIFGQIGIDLETDTAESKDEIRISFIDFLNETEGLYSESRLRHQSLGYEGLFLDAARRIAECSGLTEQWEFIRAPFFRYIADQWPSLSFDISILRFNMDERIAWQS